MIFLYLLKRNKSFIKVCMSVKDRRPDWLAGWSRSVCQGQTDWLADWLAIWQVHYIHTWWYKLNPFSWYFCISCKEISHLRIYIKQLIYIYILFKSVCLTRTDRLTGWLKSVCLSSTDRLTDWLADWLILYIHTLWYNLNPFSWYFCIFWNEISHLLKSVCLSRIDGQTDWLAEVGLSVKDRQTDWLTGWLSDRSIISIRRDISWIHFPDIFVSSAKK